MGGDYAKGVYDQLMEVIVRLDTMEAAHVQDQREIKMLTSEVGSLRKENARLREEVSGLRQENAALRGESATLRKEDCLLRKDNERMERILNNDSSNSSLPPSKDQPGKASNTYNGRKSTKKRPGAQPSHKGNSLSRAEVLQKIQDGVYGHRIEEIGVTDRPYITRYRLDLDVRTIATEIRIHAGDDGKSQVPDDLRADVSYGGTVRAIAAFLYSEGGVANDRICTFINSLSGDGLHISTGSVYGLCKKFSEACSRVGTAIEQGLLNAPVICTDATPVRTDGRLTYIRNFSTERYALYCSCEKKDLVSLGELRILKSFTGTFIHDHETALYHFGTRYGECNVHLKRYLLKNIEETGNTWSHKMACFLEGLNRARKVKKQRGETCFSSEQLERYASRYDGIIAIGQGEDRHTRGRIAKREEKTLLTRLIKYKANHLLFLYDLRIHYSNNMSEKDLRICKGR